ncbi:MAG: hypothetical protein R2857_00165 [Vampirovibrionales bacterium]
MSGTDAKCFDDSSLGSNIQVELLHGNVVYAPITNGGLGTACIGGGDPWEGCEQLSDANEQYSVVELVTSSATSFSGKTKAFRIRAIDQAYKRVGAGVGIHNRTCHGRRPDPQSGGHFFVSTTRL